MKIFIHILTLLAVVLIIFNATQLNLDALLEGQSLIALITIIASLCAIMLLQILRISKKIEAKSKGL
ncbi:hypothetical protein [Mesoflavibacter zeaxanthinifaciens]|uniref:hypothetical protein n=1 Tax=Mesoflavibacter zeaxanthinifaciens TaxID=393060 RepID=UPI003A91AA20